ncbi:MAG: glucose-6-phosphate isomerase [Evtepia sp.]|uniref:glucose-6-phosphate isomerase n=1 Tax=Evtepia sp. TaxID=2773933 RepID=UPI002A75D613|nr:glucose-6-phosphate isomerase [Evtepia sp.]MDY3013886.1 glucose-6-phosphate isomerase [Evtepia sp.]
MLQFDVSNALPFLPDNWLSSRLDGLTESRNLLEKGTGLGGGFTGWVRLPENYDQQELSRLLHTAKIIQSQSEVLVVIGIGGSYLGARAMLEMLTSPNYNLLCKKTPQIFFTGNTLSPDTLTELLDYVRNKDFSVNVISKSGSTTEPSIAFLLFRQLLEEKYGRDGARDRIFVTTDRHEGTLRQLANQEGYATFSIPNNIGGRYSVLTPAGLLPLAVAGLRVKEILAGAADAMVRLRTPGQDNPAWQYAAARNALYESGKPIEILACYEPSFRFFGEWWKQLFGESEGKEGLGVFPASVEFTADLHSMGQYIQEGTRNLFETVVRFVVPLSSCLLDPTPGDLSGLDFLRGKDLRFVNEQARKGTALAHVDGGVPNLLLSVDERTPYWAGQLVYFFEYACGLSGYLLGLNPFNQPGVEAYKENMFALLGKPGHEAHRDALLSR